MVDTDTATSRSDGSAERRADADFQRPQSGRSATPGDRTRTPTRTPRDCTTCERWSRRCTAGTDPLHRPDPRLQARADAWSSTWSRPTPEGVARVLFGAPRCPVWVEAWTARRRRRLREALEDVRDQVAGAVGGQIPNRIAIPRTLARTQRDADDVIRRILRQDFPGLAVDVVDEEAD